MVDSGFVRTVAKLRQQIFWRTQEVFTRYTQNFPELAANFLALSADAIQGGKCFRGLCAILGAACALSTTPQYQHSSAPELLYAAAKLPNILDLAAALELYQASALVHDDVVDRADTRRGLPALRQRFSDLHASENLVGENVHFGDAAAILAGDLLFSMANAALADNTQPVAVLRGFSLMSSEVAYGQYLDLQLSYTPLDQCTLDKILEVVKVKSARYSVVYPTILGVLSTFADDNNDALVQFLQETLEPAGIAFQLRDDALGVFGDPTVTGKPAGDDIREGKRTALLALTLQNADVASRQRLEQIYGLPNCERPILETVELFQRFGTSAHEQLIAAMSDQAAQQATQAKTRGIHALLDYLIAALTIRVT